MKITGIRDPAAMSRRCKSEPSIPGIRTSKIRHAVSATRDDWRKSSAEGNTAAVNPIDRKRLLMASRIDSSSSTIEMTEFSGNRHAAFLRSEVLSFTKRTVTRLQSPFYYSLVYPSSRSTRESNMHGVEQLLLPERFGQESDCAGVKSGKPRVVAIVCSNKDDWDSRPGRRQVPL
jgi:hypothetical protein